MPGLTNLFTAFGKSLSKTEAKSVAKTVSKSGSALKSERAREVATSTTARGVAAKPKTLTTQTKMAAQVAPEGYFKSYAKNMAGSKTVQTASKVGLAGVAIGGGVYVLGKGTGAGSSEALSGIGYGYRNLTNSRTPTEIRRDELNNIANENDLVKEKMGILKDYTDFLNSNGLTDTPTNRGVYDDYILGPQTEIKGPEPTFMEQYGGKMMGGGALLLAAVGGYLIYKGMKKKRGKK